MNKTQKKLWVAFDNLFYWVKRKKKLLTGFSVDSKKDINEKDTLTVTFTFNQYDCEDIPMKPEKEAVK